MICISFVVCINMKSRFLKDTYAVWSLQIKRNAYRKEHHRPASTQALPQDVKPFNEMPALSSIPLVGSLHHFLPGGEIGPDAQLFNKFGHFETKYGHMMKMAGVFGRSTFVFMFQPEHFEQVYRNEEVNPSRPGFETLTYYREVMRQSTFKGVHGLTTAQGPKWRDFRTKVNPAFLKPKLVKLYAPGLEEIAEEMVAKLSKLKDNPKELEHNIESEITKWSLESVAFVGLGARLQCMEDGLPDDHPSRQLIQCARDFVEFAFKLEIMPSPWKYFSTPNFRKIVKVFDTQWDVSSKYIFETRDKIKSRGYDIPEEDKSILEKLLAIDETVAVMMGNEMLLAGIDTVTFTTMALLYQLGVNQEAQDKLRQEIRAGNSSRYLRACLKESLRIWHVVPANLRRTTKDHFVGGYHVPEGVDVIAPNQYLCNTDRYYPRAKEFLPERWLAEKNDPLYHGNTHPMINLPFGFGVRSCIGRRIAELEIEIFIKKLINDLKITWDGPPMKVKSMLMNSLEMPFHIRFESAK